MNDSEADTVTEHDQSYTTEDAADEVKYDRCYTEIYTEYTVAICNPWLGQWVSRQFLNTSAHFMP